MVNWVNIFAQNSALENNFLFSEKLYNLKKNLMATKEGPIHLFVSKENSKKTSFQFFM